VRISARAGMVGKEEITHRSNTTVERAKLSR
jgi:hypothetical protein